MNLSEYRDEIKLKLTGDLLESELDDNTIDKIIKTALREVQRYITTTKLITIPYTSCIDFSTVKDENEQPIKVNSVVMVFRTDGTTGTSDASSTADPMQVAQWQLISGMGNLAYFQDAVANYGAWTTLQQMRNTTSTDLAFRFDKTDNKLYINVSTGTPRTITIEYVPKYDDVSQITSDYWIDILMRLSIALTKVTLGRIRTRYTQSNALWNSDGETILNEGRQELESLRQMLIESSDVFLPID